MQTLYLIRHTTPAIAPGTCYGQLDIGVASSFAQEAQQVRELLPQVEFILTSPLSRARKLAEYLAQERHSEVRSDARLMEKHFGDWEGRAWDSIAREEIEAWTEDVEGYAPAGGESARQVARRVRAVLREVAQLPHDSIAVTTHGGIIRTILAQLGETPLTDVLRWEVGYGAVIAVRNSRR